MTNFDCSICLSAFKVPKLLPCFHTFCLECLDEYVNRNGQNGRFECPLCRSSTVIPEGGVTSFQPNFYIQQGVASEVDSVCDICGDGHYATEYCLNCEEHFCERCSTFHMKMKVSREHSLLQLNDSSSNDGKSRRKVFKKFFCSHHSGEEIKMVCKDCDSLLCVVCKLTEHENHNTSSLKDEVEGRRQSLILAIASAKRQLNFLNSRKLKYLNQATNVKEKHQESIVALEKRVEALIDCIKKHADNIQRQLETSHSKVMEYYTGTCNQIEEAILERRALINHAQNVVDLGNDIHAMDAGLLLKVLSVVQTLKFTVRKPKYFVFEASDLDITAAMIGETMGVLSDVNVNKICEIDAFLNTQNAIAISVDVRMVYAAFTDYDQFLCHDTEKMNSSFKEILEVKGTCAGIVCIGPDMYYTSTTDKSVYKLTTNEYKKTKFHSFKDYPHGIAYRHITDKNEEKELLICTNKNAEVMNLEASKGMIYAVSLTDSKRNIWRDKEMPGATCIAVNEADETVCLGYPAAHKVSLLSFDGIVLAEFCGTGCPGDSERFCPVSVCFDSQGCIIVADHYNQTVLRIDDCCNFLQSLFKGRTPLSVAIGENDMLYVGFDSKNITIYKLYLQNNRNLVTEKSAFVSGPN